LILGSQASTKISGAVLTVSLLAGALGAVGTAQAATRPLTIGAVAVWGTVGDIEGKCFPHIKHKKPPQPTCTFTVTTATDTISVQAFTTTLLSGYSTAADIHGFIAGDSVWVKGPQAVVLAANKVIYNYPTAFPVPATRERTTNAKFSSITTTTPPQLTVTQGTTTLTFTVAPGTKYRLNTKPVKSVTFQTNDALKIASQLYTDNNEWTLSVFVTRKAHKA
jgi:hypothetical protein